MFSSRKRTDTELSASEILSSVVVRDINCERSRNLDLFLHHVYINVLIHYSHIL